MGDPTGFKLTLDFDHGTVGFSVADVLEELQDVVGQLFPAAPSALGWLPDSGETAVGFQVDLNSGTMSGDVAVSTEQGEPLATAIAIFEPGAGAEQRAVEISLDKQIDLSGTPLFGGLLSGVRVTDLAVSVTVAGDGTLGGAVYVIASPDALEVAESVPQAEPVQPDPLNVHVTPLF